MKLTSRLLLQMLAVIAVMLVSVIVIIDYRLHERIVEESRMELAREARLIALQWNEKTNTDSLAAVAGAATDHRVTLIAPDGTVIGDTDFPGDAVKRLQNHSTRPEVVQARASGIGSSLRLSPSTGEEQLYVAVRVPLGTTRVSVTTRAVEDSFDAARRDVLLAGFLSLLLAAAVAVLFSRVVSRPIVELRDVARSIAAGDLSARPALAAPGEVGDLADAVHRLGEQMSARVLALESERARLSALVDSLNEGVIAIDPEQRIVQISPAARELLGIRAPIPFPLDFLPREPALRRAVADALAGKPTGPVELQLEKKIFSLNAVPLLPGGAVVALFDLGPVRRLEAVRRDFVANVSHELRTPLTVVSGFAETIADPSLPRERAVEFAGTILTHARRMQRLVDDLLDLSRIESGGWSPKPEEIRVKEVLEDITHSAVTTAREKGLQVNIVVAPEASRIWADRTAFAQIALNLLENAIRHTSAGSVTIGSRRAADGAELFVTDTGSGIAEEHLPRIFERFYRVDTGRARETGGTGLGLAIVRHLAEAHGGGVSADSKLGSGTTIAVFFPDAARSS
jgi:signal transduction histidine kinase